MRMLWLVVLWCPAACWPETRRLYNCVNDDSTSDSYGDTCSWYDGRTWGCGSYDDNDFTASAQCCACGGGLVGSATPAPTLDGCALYVVGPVVASSGNKVATVDSLQNYELTFTMELASDWSITNKFQSVLHIGSADQDRFPNILFNPSQYGSGLHVAQSYGDCSPSFCQWYLGTGSFAAAGGTYEIKVVVENNQMTVYIDGVNRGSKSGSATYAAANAAVYVGDPWYDAAKVTLSDITLSDIALADTCRANIAATTAGACFSEDFSSIDSNWVSVDGDWSWSDGTVDNTDASGPGDILYMDADYDDGYLEASVSISNGGDQAGLLFRIADMPSAANYYNDAGQMYYCGILPNSYQLVICGRMNYGWSTLFTYYTGITYGQFYDLGINMDGSDFTVFLDGAEIGSFSDSSYSSGGIGLRVRQARGIYDSISYKAPGCAGSSSPFVYVDQEMSWEDARAHCRANYHDLASIHSASENAEVDALCPVTWCWIGGSDSVSEGTWTWLDGSAWDYENWLTGQPQNSGGEDYMFIEGSKWHDAFSYHKLPFVCGTKAPTNRGADEEDDDDEDSDGDALVVILCVIGAFFGGAVFVGATVNKCAAKSAKVAATTGAAAVPNAATDDGDTITVEAPPGTLGLKFDRTSTRVKEVFSDSPLVGKVYPGDVLKSVNGVLTFGKYLATAADDCAAYRTLVFLRKKQPMRPATIVRMGTVEAVHAADASAAPPVQATLVPHATVLSVQQP